MRNVTRFTLETDEAEIMAGERHGGRFYAATVRADAPGICFFVLPATEGGAPDLDWCEAVDENKVPRDAWRTLRDRLDAWSELAR